MLATQPNVNPPVITTGVGPAGWHIVYYQAPGISPAQSQSVPQLQGVHTLLQAIQNAEQALADQSQDNNDPVLVCHISCLYTSSHFMLLSCQGLTITRRIPLFFH